MKDESAPETQQRSDVRPPEKRRWGPRRFLLGASGVLLVAALILFFDFHSSSVIRQPSPADPRLTYEGPFQNVHPAVGYVADERCRDCHADIARTFAQHPMGRSLAPVARVPAPPEGPDTHLPFDALGSQFLIRHDGDHVWHRRVRHAAHDGHGSPEVAAELDWEVQYVLGSGSHGYSYLSDRDGYLYETPLSWYTQKRVWDLSPGFRQRELTGRAIVAGCLFCHANRTRLVAGSINHYREPVFDGYAIGCQRCHGPGELHVARREQGEPVTEARDTTIVNPRWLGPAARDAVCEQCHLQGAARVPHRGLQMEDFRPGLPAELFWSEFIKAAEPGAAPKAVGHVEQMYQSRCFQATSEAVAQAAGAGEQRSGVSAGSGDPRRAPNGDPRRAPNGDPRRAQNGDRRRAQGVRRAERLSCVSCHDPHEREAPAQRVAHYRERCLHCHEDQGCSLSAAERLRRSPEDSCIDCHMPRYGTGDIPHTASTDHRIPRGGKERGKANEPPRPDRLPLVPFYRGGVAETEAERDRAIALVNWVLEGNRPATDVVGPSLAALDAAARRDGDDLKAAETRAYGLALQRRGADALAAFRAVLAKAPDRERAVLGAAAAAEEVGDASAARDYWRRAISLNPWVPGYHRNLALLLVKQQAWADAEAVCRHWLRLDPMSAEAHATRLRCLLATGDKAEARKVFARIEALAPDNLQELRIRFEKKLR